MATRNRTLHLAAVLTLLAALLLPLVAAVSAAAESQSISAQETAEQRERARERERERERERARNRNQNQPEEAAPVEAAPVEAPPAEPPPVDVPPAVDPAPVEVLPSDPAAVDPALAGPAVDPALAQATTPAAGADGEGRPDRFPAEVEVGEQRFLFDREVPTATADLIQVGAQGDVVLYARSDQPPFPAIYASAPAEPEPLGRFLPELPVGADGTAGAANPCPAQTQSIADLETDGGTYTFAGYETDLTSADLTAFAQSGADTVYAAPGEATPRELFVETAAGLERYVVLDAAGRPAAFPSTLEFGGQSFTDGGDVTGTVDPASLVPVGCAGAFPLAAPTGASEAPFTQLYGVVGGRLFSYVGAGTAPKSPGEAAGTPAIEAAETATADPAIGQGEATEAAQPTEPSAAETVEAATGPTGEDTTAVPTEESSTPDPSTDAEDPSSPATGDGEFPEEVVLEDARFGLDRSVPLDSAALSEVGADAGLALLAEGDAGPYARLYGAEDPGSGVGARYVAQIPVDESGTPSTDGQCVAETANFAPIALGEDEYVSAGLEADLATADLEVVITTDAGEPIYAETTDQPFPELFFGGDGDLNRFVLLDAQGVPANIGETVAFGGQSFSFAGVVTGQVDPATLARAGCVGPYGARVDQGAEAGNLSTLYVILTDQPERVLSFTATSAPSGGEVEAPAETVATPTETVAPTETVVPATSTPEPTETPLPPTETPAPTETAVPPTETPAPTETPIPPTETPVPTETPSPTETPVPTAAPEPTAASAPDETAVPATETPPTETAVAPTETATVEETPPPAEATATAAPTTAAAEATATIAETTTADPSATVETTPAAPSDAPVQAVALPTVAPNETPVSAIPVDAPAPIPAEFPREIEVQGIRYLFDLEVDLDLQSLVQVDTLQTPDASLGIFASQDQQASSGRRSFMAQTLRGPFVRIYAVADAGVIARYLPEAPVTPAGTIDLNLPCSAEATSSSFRYTFEGAEYQYAFASTEVNVSIETLRSSTTSLLGAVPTIEDGRELLVQGGASGFAEVFVAGGERLERYTALNTAGFPVSLNNLVFAESRFEYRAEVSVSVSQAGLQRIGCAGAFPLYAPPPQAQAQAPLAVCYTVVDNRVYEFTATTIVEAPISVNTVTNVTNVTNVTVNAVPPPAGVVQIVLQAPNAQPAPTPLPNVRVVPLPAQPGQTPTPTPASGVVAEAPVLQRQCQGDPGQIGANGLPERLPARIQLSGIAYSFIRIEETAGDILLTRIGCVGPFEAAQAEGLDLRQVIFLRDSRAAETLYRFEAASSFEVQFTVTGDPQVIVTGDQTYVREATWRRSVYSSITNILYAEDPESLDPPRLYGVKVDGDVIAEYVPEGGDVVAASEELRQAAEAEGINPDLVLGGERRYLLVNLWRPIGTTTNGWVTLYSFTAEGGADSLLATDPRSLDLFIYRRSGT